MVILKIAPRDFSVQECLALANAPAISTEHGSNLVAEIKWAEFQKARHFVHVDCWVLSALGSLLHHYSI